MNVMKRFSGRNKLLLALAGILLVSYLGLSFVNYTLTRASVHAEILRNDLPLTMDNIYSELTAMMTRPLLVSSSMASDTFLKDWAMEGEADPERIIRYLSEIQEKYDFFTTFFVSAGSSRYFRYNGIHKIISESDKHDVWYFDFVASGREYDFDVDNDEAAGNILTIFINYRVVDAQGRLLGVTGVGLKVDNVANRVAEYQEKYDRIVYLTDKNGLLQVHPDTTLIEKTNIRDMSGMSEVAEYILAGGVEAGNYEFDRENQRFLLTVRYIESLGWYLYVEQNESKALVLARHNFLRTMLIGLLVSIVIIVLTLLTINRYQAQIESLIVTDELTGTANRRALQAEFQRFFYEFGRSGRPFCLFLLDLDGFKKVNDRLGHMAGDHFLKDLVEVIRSIVRPTDTLARWGGDEFVIITPGSLGDALSMAARVRLIISESDLAGPGSRDDDPRKMVTVSVGISEYKAGDDFDAMLARADKAMYRGKASGGNIVQIAD